MPLLTSVDWFKITNQGSRERRSSNVNTHRSGYFSADLVFPNGFRFDDVGSYVCTATSNDRTSAQSSEFTLELVTSPVFPPFMPVPCLQLVNSDTVYFQILILNASCSDWDASLKQQIIYEIQQSIVGVVTARCDECSAGSDAVMLNTEPTCSSQRTIIRGTISSETQDVFCTLNSWHQSGSTVQFRNTLHLIDQSCNLEIESLNDMACSEVTETEIVPATVQRQQLAAAAVGSTAVGVLLAIAAAVVVICVTAVLLIRRR